MTTSLRSVIQFSPLDRKLRQLSKINDWQERVWQVARPALVEFGVRRAAMSGEADVMERQHIEHGLDRVKAVHKPVSDFGLPDIIQLAVGLLGRDPGLRRTPRKSSMAAHVPLDPLLVPQALERFLDWVRSQAFAEMHPVEQMTLCQIRLYEISPFAAASEVVSDLFAILVLYRRNGLLPLFSGEEADLFPEALSAAFGFATKALVDLNAKGCERTCDEILRQP